ncbi:MAG: SIS domain-containing protein [Gammaproteobacteria bacterium]|nr:SIS domain-containing protein [Gammaproteobacteria bacterium]MBV8307559.1 SIS domain-containing protein [Gammaproteobacteria bacterium]
MFREAAEAPRVIAAQLAANATPIAQLAARLRATPPRAVVTCARGSSDHAATFARYLIETRLGLLTSSAAPSVSSVYEAATDLGGTLLLAISQSGASPDLLAVVSRARAAGAHIVALVNAPGSPLAQLADELLPLHAGPERAVAATKSYLASLGAIVQLVAAWCGDESLAAALAQAPTQLARAWELDWSAAVTRLTAATSLYVIGRGLGLGVVQEAALKLKETCGLHAEAISAAELRHGPMALVGAGFPLLMFAQHDESRAGVLQLATEVAAQGADVLLAGGQLPQTTELPSESAHPVIEPLLFVQSFYRMANALALARGYNPDAPPHLRKVTETV